MELPSWYWTSGLHDAKITDFRNVKFDYDYTQSNPIRNCITVKLDARNALFETKIKEIKFLNAKIVKGDMDCVDWFWKEDSIKQTYKGYELEITAISYPNTKKCVISFEDIIIER